MILQLGHHLKIRTYPEEFASGVSAAGLRESGDVTDDVVGAGVGCPAGDDGGRDDSEDAGAVVSGTGRLEIGC